MNAFEFYDVICCPLCDYVTGVSRWSHGPANARGALASHLHRKRHGLSRAEALALAKWQPVKECYYDPATFKYLRETVRDKPHSVGARRDA